MATDASADPALQASTPKKKMLMRKFKNLSRISNCLPYVAEKVLDSFIELVMPYHERRITTEATRVIVSVLGQENQKYQPVPPLQL